MQLPLKDEGGNLVRDAQGRELSDAFFCPFDAVAGEGSTMISLTRLVERLDNEGGTNLFLVDACRDDFDPHRGLGKRSLSGDELVGRLPGNSAILFSCSKGQQCSSTSRRGAAMASSSTRSSRVFGVRRPMPRRARSAGTTWSATCGSASTAWRATRSRGGQEGR